MRRPGHHPATIWRPNAGGRLPAGGGLRILPKELPR
jgi:hypothetical protein